MTRMTPSEAFVETLAAHGVKHVFGIVGSAYMDALDLFPPAGIRFISVAHEQNAGHMADGYSRGRGRHGVCIAQNGPGITNFVTAIAAAYWAHSPVVVITPETGSNTHGPRRLPGDRAAADLLEDHQVPGAMSAQPAHRRADQPRFDYALTERGPTQINIPRDFFYGEIDVTDPEADQDRARRRRAGEPGRGREAAGRGQVSGHHGRRRRGDGRTAQAEAMSSPNTSRRRSSTPTCTTTFPDEPSAVCGPLGYQGSKAAMKLIAQADVVLALGSRLGPFGTLPQHGIEYWPKDAKIIQVDTNHRACSAW